MLVFSLLTGCCDAPELSLVDPGVIALEVDEVARIPLAELGVEDAQATVWTVESEPGVDVQVLGEILRIAPEEGWTGVARVDLQGTNACDLSDELLLEVQVGDVIELGDPCETVFRYDSQTAEVYLAGSFTDWQTEPMEQVDGGWELRLELEPGIYTYKYVDGGTWVSPPDAELLQCDEGVGMEDCNGMVVVSDCSIPKARLSSLDIDRENNALSATVAADRQIAHTWVELDGLVVVDEDGPAAPIELSGLSEGRHSLRITITDLAGAESEQLYVPFWTDDRDWASGLMYYVFVDRFADGDGDNNSSEGTNASLTDYLGGDWQGVIDELDYLESLGVTVLWLTAPQDQPSGAWGDNCGANFSGYHGYWPQDPWAVEEHFGDDALLRELIDQAHSRGMRVLIDWVANHVHQEHPYYADHPEWFNELLICEGAVWDTHPETCWFDSFLPDIDYYQADPLVRMVDDAILWAKDYELDGYRVDAVKHMPNSVFYNLQSRVKRELEHVPAGGDQDFYTVGETFSGDRGLIGEYVSEDQLDAQFDFPLYWAVLSVLGRGEGSMSDLDQAREDSAEAFDGFVMSTFLGNHDVERFVSHASGEVSSLYGDGPCGGDGWLRGPAESPSWEEPYQRIRLAWTFLLTSRGLPLLYYGDEIGLPGFHDPDNRQPMRFPGSLSPYEESVLEHVRILGQARLEHSSLSLGLRTRWWVEDDLLAWSQVDDQSQALVLLNRSGQERSLTNGVAFAGLDEGVYVDLFSEEVLATEGDSLTVRVGAMDSRVLVLQ